LGFLGRKGGVRCCGKRLDESEAARPKPKLGQSGSFKERPFR
jgi:hypothetical protein